MEDTNPIGSASQFAWGFENSPRVPDLSTVRGMQVEKESFIAKISEDTNTNLDPTNEQLAGEQTRVDLSGGSFDKRMDVDSLAPFLAHAHGYADIVVPTPGVGVWECRRPMTGDAALAHSVSSIFGLVYRDDSIEELLLGGKSQKHTLKATKNKIIDFNAGIIFSHHTHMADPVFAVSTGTFVGQLVARGNNDETSTDVIKLECVTAGALGTAEFKAAVGAATALGGASTKMKPRDGVWFWVIDSDGTFLGLSFPAQRVELMLTGAGAFAVGDKFTISQQRGQTSVTFSARKPLTATACVLIVDGEEIEYESMQSDFMYDHEAYGVGGSAFASRVLRNGQRKATVSIDRMRIDRVLYRMLQRGEKVGARITMYGDIITGAYYEKWDRFMEACKLTDAGGNGTDGPNAQKEKVTLYASKPSSGNPSIVDTVTCSLETLV